MLFPFCIALAGVGILLNVHKNVHVEYAAVFFVAMGLFGALPTALYWYIMSLEGHFERAVRAAWMIGFGNIGGIVATFSFLAVDAPLYHKGYSIVTFGLCLCASASIANAVGFYLENRRRGGTRSGPKLLLW